MHDDKFYEELSNLINGAFDDVFGRKTGDRKTPNTKAMAANPAIGEIMTDDLTDFALDEQKPEKTTNDSARDHFPNLYESIGDYTAQTGKRFRMTKNQKARGLSRDEAFSEMYGGTN